MVSQTEQARQQIQELAHTPVFGELDALADVKALGADPRPGLLRGFRQTPAAPELFPAGLTHAAVERDLPYWPQPAGCPLTFENASAWIASADAAVARCRGALDAALLEKARLLRNPALRERLEQGRHEVFIAALLDAPDGETLARVLSDTLSAAGSAGSVETLKRWLKKVTVHKVRIADFHPEKHTLEAQEIDGLVGEFKRYLLAHLPGQDPDEITILEIE